MASAELSLKALIQACEFMRDASGYYRPRNVHETYGDQWQAWTKQIKIAKASLKADASADLATDK